MGFKAGTHNGITDTSVKYCNSKCLMHHVIHAPHRQQLLKKANPVQNCSCTISLFCAFYSIIKKNGLLVVPLFSLLHY